MKFSWKVFFLTIVVTAVTFGAAGYILISSIHTFTLEREIKLSQNENRILSFTFESIVENLTDYMIVSDDAVMRVADKIEANIGDQMVRIYDASYNKLFDNINTDIDSSLFDNVGETTTACRIIAYGDRFFVQTAGVIRLRGQNFYIENLRDITPVYMERSDHYSIYLRITVVILLVSTVTMYCISVWLTRPIRLLSAAVNRIAGGEYDKRVKKISGDELGALTCDFNKMADTLEEKINALEQTARQREDFIGSFAHELKTPLTSIIGYADMLRTRDMPPDQRFTAASYIFSEGRRLEALSLKLMELVILRRRDFVYEGVNTVNLFNEIKGILEPVLSENGMRLLVKNENAVVHVEPDLMKALLINLIDNARKASEPGADIYMNGKREDGKFIIEIIDHGRGIPAAELAKITEAFYMIDKSRSRVQNGVGLGLSICAEIAGLHNTRLSFESAVSVGTKAGISLECL